MSYSFGLLNTKKELEENYSNASSTLKLDRNEGSPKSVSSSTSPSPNKRKPKFNFSSSFIMEDLVSEGSRRQSPKKKVEKSFFSFIDDLDEEPHFTRRLSRPSSPHARSSMNQSAFNFMNQSTFPINTNPLSIYDYSDKDTVASLSLSRSTIKQDNEVKYLNVQSGWNQIQQKKATEMKWIESIYQKQAMVMDQIKSIRDTLASTEEEKKEAIASEDFQLAEQHLRHIKLLNKNLTYLMHDQLDELTQEMRLGWQRMIDALEQEAESAEEVVQYGQLVKEERNQKLNKFISDMDLIHNAKIQDMERKREGLETAKSEVAFDLDMWNQNDAELKERKEEVIHDEMKKKRELVEKSEKTKKEIIELKEKLRVAESENRSLSKEIADVDMIIKEKLQPFTREDQELQQEKETISNRQTEIEEENVMLNREDEDIQADIRKQNEKKKQDEHELEALDLQIQSAIQRQKSSQSEIETLKTTCQNLIQERDIIVAQHQQQMKEAKEKINEKSKNIKSLSQSLYHKENACINLEDFITNITSKLTRLTKLKQLAVHNQEFENAAQLSQEIKQTEISLDEAKSKKEAQSHLESMKERVAQEKSNLNELKQEQADKEKENVLNIEKALENVKDNLQNMLSKEAVKEYRSFKSIAQLEIQSIQAQLHLIREYQ